MTVRFAAPLVLSLLLAACASSPERGPLPPASAGAPPPSPKPTPPPRPALKPQAAPGASSEAILYRCAGGRRFTAAWGLEPDRVLVTAGGVSRTLPPQASASGARYGDAKYQIWGKGDEAMLEGFPGGPYRDCRAG